MLNVSIIDLINEHQLKAKFVLVGIWNTIFGYGVFCLLDSFFLHLSIARHVAYMSAMVFRPDYSGDQCVHFSQIYNFQINCKRETNNNRVFSILYDLCCYFLLEFDSAPIRSGTWPHTT